MIQPCHFLISWLRLPDENPFFQESIFIWHFNANLVQNTNSQDDNDSNSQLRIVFERERQKLCEQWPKYRIFWRYLKDKVETQWKLMLIHCISGWKWSTKIEMVTRVQSF